ncbi:MAG TPA: hypothetical protein VE152_06715 [Acidimicrobiales bacterium]|nr:hypothetical protein [Acidimicrobiales bacterium]
MKFLDALLGRTQPVKADLDALFALPSAAITLQAAAGLVSSGQAGVCYKPGSGRGFAATQEELDEVLRVDSGERGSRVHEEVDSYGYRWVVVEHPLLEDLVNRAHMVNATLQDRGYGPQLLCSVFAFGEDADPAGAGQVELESGGTDRAPAGAGGGSTYLVYLYKRGTFYPFAPRGHERRDQELELRLRGMLENELPVEEDLTRWFPLWGLPLR